MNLQCPVVGAAQVPIVVILSIREPATVYAVAEDEVFPITDIINPVDEFVKPVNPAPEEDVESISFTRKMLLVGDTPKFNFAIAYLNSVFIVLYNSFLFCIRFQFPEDNTPGDCNSTVLSIHIL